MSDDLPDRLLAVLRDTTGTPTLEFAAPPERLTGGFWADLLAFRPVGGPDGWDHDLVARVMPEPAVARKETIVQAEVARLGFATPVVRASGGPEDGLGRAFMVMDRAAGRPLLDGLAGGHAFARFPRLARTIPDTLAVTMARLHDLDPAPVRDRLAGCEGVATTVTGFLEGLRSSSEERGRRDLADAGRWLADHSPPAAPEVICHGDLHPFNLLIDDDGQVTVLDWSAALVGHRTYDVAFTSLVIAEPPIVVPAPVRPVARAAGRWLSRRFVARYRHHSGFAVDAGSLRWHQAVVCLRALVEVSGWEGANLGRQTGHPWLVSGPAFASRLSKLTRVPVRPR